MHEITSLCLLCPVFWLCCSVPARIHHFSHVDVCGTGTPCTCTWCDLHTSGFSGSLHWDCPPPPFVQKHPKISADDSAVLVIRQRGLKSISHTLLCQFDWEHRLLQSSSTRKIEFSGNVQRSWATLLFILYNVYWIWDGFQKLQARPKFYNSENLLPVLIKRFAKEINAILLAMGQESWRHRFLT